jgi:hypothetical protein
MISNGIITQNLIDMKEAKIIAFTGIYGCLIMANTSTGKYFPWFWVGLAIFWTGRYIYLTAKD